MIPNMFPKLSVGQKLTVFYIDSTLAMTRRTFLEVRSVSEPIKVPGDGEERIRLGTYRVPRRRRESFLDVPPTWLMFDGWNVPFKADTDGPGMSAGNACYNLVGAAVIRHWIETKNLNPGIGDADKAKVLAWSEFQDSASEGTLVFPEIPSNHAVVKRLKAAGESGDHP